MTTRIRRAVLGLAASALALSACSSTPGTAQTPPTAGPSPTTSTAGSGAPKVANPLPAGTLDRDPCSTLTAAQVNALLGASATGEPQDTGVAKMCHWANLDRGSGISVQLVYAWKDGLGHVYAKKNEGFFKELEPVQGYPTVAYGPSDDSSTGRCGVAIGISDTMAFEADATISRSNVGKPGSDPCEAARRIGDAVVTTLKAGA
ncbi:DUF3558 domain-containing protein [Amycolatopsis echigonensis]|uniref:DUF3558 domain-containing protein n=1 Tax=Amycolatopsis echigonensis TaxID=2576905 RepID=A0A2N3WJN2_9PSEU|nr:MULTISPECIES: DUF3558 domain-containing protein [Amycolatopsis]MBB2501475.1 DUF3558 domain-containing protein [Amycolatopsis echigonensis]PKV94081.1 uncharacterized protein DUF3558 [Amycolatopsis niigatensis]